MMVRLNPKIKTMRPYDPPIPVERHFDDPDTKAPANQQIDHMLWIPATLVCRWLGQHPFLENEADELFSIGVLTLTEIVNRNRYRSDEIGAIVYARCHYAMESYINNLNSIVKVSTSTRYKNRREGKSTPCHIHLKSGNETKGDDHLTSHWQPAQVVDDHSDLLVRDACEVLGYDYNDLTLKQKRRLAEVLID